MSLDPWRVLPNVQRAQLTPNIVNALVSLPGNVYGQIMPLAPLEQPKIDQLSRQLAIAALLQRHRAAATRDLLYWPSPTILPPPRLQLTQPTLAKVQAEHASEAVKSAPKISTIPSERSSVSIMQECKSPEVATETLKLLGSTLRSKSDPFIDTSIITDPGAPMSFRGGRSEFFPDRLYRMLKETEEQGRTDIVAFLPHGRAFVILKKDVFVETILPTYFTSQTKWESFHRQLNLYGFLKVSDGPDAGAYYHELFLRGYPKLCRYMRRCGAPHGLDRRKYKLPDGFDPNFYSMKPLKVLAEEG